MLRPVLKVTVGARQCTNSENKQMSSYFLGMTAEFNCTDLLSKLLRCCEEYKRTRTSGPVLREQTSQVRAFCRAMGCCASRPRDSPPAPGTPFLPCANATFSLRVFSDHYSWKWYLLNYCRVFVVVVVCCVGLKRLIACCPVHFPVFYVHVCWKTYLCN